jgi:hypothetical protein
LVDCTALLAESIPVAAITDLSTGMSEDVSLGGKYWASATTYCGLGSVYTRLNFRSRKLFGITDETPEWKTTVHDTAYTAAFNGVVTPIFYFASGERDLKQLVMTSGLITAALTINGRFAMGAAEWARDLTGLEPCGRKSYPDLLRKRKPRTKKLIAAALLATALTGIWGIYSTHEDGQNVQPNERNQASLLEASVTEES